MPAGTTRLCEHGLNDCWSCDPPSPYSERPAADLCSDLDPGLFAEGNELPPIDSSSQTMIGEADDTGQSVLVNRPLDGTPDAAVVDAASVRTDAGSIGHDTQNFSKANAPRSGDRYVRPLSSRTRARFRGHGSRVSGPGLAAGRCVALKIPKFDARRQFESDRAVSPAKRRTMASVLHRNLCPIFDVDEQDGIHFLTMAFIDGEPLSQIMKAMECSPTDSQSRESSNPTGSRIREKSDRALKSPVFRRSRPRQIAALIRKLCWPWLTLTARASFIAT